MDRHNADASDSSLTSLERQTRFRSVIIAFMQIGGGSSVILSMLAYGPGLPRTPALIVASVALAMGIGFLVLAAFRWLTGPFARILMLHKLDNNAVEEGEVVIYLCCCMMLIDAALSVGLVTATGGIFQSVFSPLPLAICTTSFTLRLAPRQLWKVVIFTISILIVGELFRRNWNLIPIEPLPLLQPGNFELAIAINLLASTLISVAGGITRDPLPINAMERALARVSDTMAITDRSIHRRALQRALRKFAGDISKSPGAATLSMVHDSETIFEQAIILAIPYDNPDEESVREAIAYLTLMAHWIDDLFDGLYKNMSALGGKNCTTERIVEHCWHLKRCVDATKFRMGLARPIQRWLNWRQRFMTDDVDAILAEPPTRSGKSCRPLKVREALLNRSIWRIAMAGMIQRCEDQAGIKDLIVRYVEVTTEGLHEPLVRAYTTMREDKNQWVVIWASAKCVLEMFDCTAKHINISCSELYSLLFAPFIVVQNLDVEIMREDFGKPFQSNIFNLSVPLETKQFVACTKLFRDNIELLQMEDPRIRTGRTQQLKALYALLGHKLGENLRHEYQELLNDHELFPS
jgi:hypothetical protein